MVITMNLNSQSNPNYTQAEQNHSANVLRSHEEMNQQEIAQEIGNRLADITTMRRRYAHPDANINIRKAAA